jgi:PAS domain S-box-containing protein
VNPRRRVLLIEDSPTQAERFRALLDQAGLEVAHAPSAETALDQLESVRPDVIVVDYHLPGLNGDEFCREIKLNVNTRAIPILMLTVERSDEAQMRGLESGADDYLAKSADPEVLLVRLRGLLRKSEGAAGILDAERFLSRARLLVVDDSPTYLHYVARELGAEHYIVEKETSGEAALCRLASERFDCALVDLEMPGIDGIEVCRRIGQMRRESRAALALVLLTSHEEKESMTTGLEAGADDYIFKSAEMPVIKARIRALLRRKFFAEENRRILEELKEKELEAVRARVEKEAAEARAAMADELAEANRKLEAASSATRAIAENAADALFMIDDKGRVSFTNPAAEKMFGFRREEMAGQLLDEKLRQHRTDEASGAESPFIPWMAAGKAVTRHEDVFFRKDGKRVEVAFSIAPISTDDQITGAVVVVRDVTERNRAEEQLRQAQKLESLGLLAGGVAHDFNNLLVGVLGNASLAQELLPPGSAKELLDGIVRAGEQAANLTRQMLAYSGKGHFLLEQLDISRMVQDVKGLVEPSIPKKIGLRLDLAPNLPPVTADRGQIQQIFMNFTLNAAEAIGDKEGEISIETGLQQVDAQYVRQHAGASELSPGTYVWLSVKDTGCGMDEATRSRVFDPFFSTKFLGRGLGLAAVAGIVRGHKGAILVDSAPNQGSTFTVLLPAAERAAMPAAAARPPAATHAGSGVVLVVDDEELVRKMAKKALENYGFQVLLADSGSAGVDLYRQQAGNIDVIVLDLSMPHMSGGETLPELRKIRPEARVIISSGYSEAEAMKGFQGNAISGFIQKPYTAGRLADKINEVMAEDHTI